MTRPGEPPIRNGDGQVVGLTDWLGNTYRVGDRILYCIGAGRGQVMAAGSVVEIAENPGSTHEPFRVRVLTERTSARWGNTARTRSAWINMRNVTAIP